VMWKCSLLVLAVALGLGGAEVDGKGDDEVEVAAIVVEVNVLPKRGAVVSPATELADVVTLLRTLLSLSVCMFTVDGGSTAVTSSTAAVGVADGVTGVQSPLLKVTEV
jgi:hypothetical protein